MREVYYGKEPFDLRLTVLRMLRQLHIIAIVTALGTVLFGGGYYVKNVLLRSENMYAAKSIYRVEYAMKEDTAVAVIYINEVSWNTYVRTQNFIDAVQFRLERFNQESGAQITVSDEELREIITAVLASDLRVPFTIVTTESPEKSVRIALAVEAVMTEEFPGWIREVESISVIDSGDTAEEVIPDVRPVRAVILSAVLSCFFAVIALLLRETGDDSIRLPASLWRRYGLKVVGTPESRELAENIAYFFEGKQRTALCAVQESVDPAEVLKQLKGKAGELPGWFAVPSPVLCPEVCRELRGVQGILLAVKAGAHAGKQLEYTKEYLEQQDCKITAAILVDADERLIRDYYFFSRRTLPLRGITVGTAKQKGKEDK